MAKHREKKRKKSEKKYKILTQKVWKYGSNELYLNYELRGHYS
jgi:hypothetical protein